MRIKSEYLDISGKELWKLRSYNDEYVFLLQDVKIHDEGVVELEVDEKCLFMEFSSKLRLCLMHIACPRAASFFFLFVPWSYLKNAVSGSAWVGNAFCFWCLSIASGIGERS
ncbi:uncharacterized protein LOC123883432 [Trifolium pratense]|uniref:uncharacterized protein LOC123883432 n=1 Tax=Trifolium pratense TaxID=57577 RepID=UPI001E697F24|nr:uncharacterized protein LOC123883432 [Trifolium pratense]